MKDLEKKHLQTVLNVPATCDNCEDCDCRNECKLKEVAAKKATKISLEFAIEQLKQVSKEYGIGLNIIPNNKIQELEKQLKEYE